MYQLKKRKIYEILWEVPLIRLISGTFLYIIIESQKIYKNSCSDLVIMLQYPSVADMCLLLENNKKQVYLWGKQGGTYDRDYGLFCS